MRQESTLRHLYGLRSTSGREVLLVADVDECQENDASEVRSRRMKTKEVLVLKEGDNFIFTFVARSAKLAGEDSEIRTSDRSLFWRRLQGSSRQFQPRSALRLPRSRGLGPARALSFPRLLPIAGLAVKSCPPGLLSSPLRLPGICCRPCRACERGQRGPRSCSVRASCRGC